MKKMIKVLCGSLCGMMICTSAYAKGTLDGVFDIGERSFSYIYRTDERRGFLNLMIYRSDSDDVILKTDDKNMDGVFSGRIIIPAAFADGRYTVDAACGEERESRIIVKSDSDILSELAKSMGESVDSVQRVLKDNNRLFDSDDKIFDAYGAQIAAYICKNCSDGMSGERLLNLRMQGEMLCLVKGKAIKFEEAVKKYESFTSELDFSEYYGFSEKERERTNSIFTGKNIAEQKAQTMLDDVFLTAKAASAENNSDLREILLGNDDFGIEFDEYNKLSNNYYQNNVFSELIGCADGWKSTADIAAAFEKAVKNQMSLQKKDSSTSSGGAKKNDYNAASGTEQAAPALDDISGHWAEAAISDLYSRGIISGYDDNTFLPEKTITRAEFTAMVVKMFDAGSGSESVFDDVKPDDWFYSAVSAAAGSGWVKGVSETGFSPLAQITREDAAVILYRASGVGAEAEEAEFSDTEDIAQYAKNAVAVMYQNGIISGYDGYFYPKREITRAETASMLYSVINKKFGAVNVPAPATGISERMYFAKQLLGYIGHLPARSGKGVTRLEFVTKVCDLFRIYNPGEQNGFKDVASGTVGADAVYTALANGWVDSAELFEPNRNITAAEAVRIVICAAGYDFQAKNFYGGTYPDAYVKTAVRYKLDDGAQINNLSGELSWDSAVMLLYNSVNSYFISGQDGLRSEETWLEMLYGIYRKGGIVNRTRINSLNASDGILDRDIIEINGERYDYSGAYNDLIGRNCTVFYSRDDVNTALFLVPGNNFEYIIDAEDFKQISEARFVYTEGKGEKSKTLRIDGGFQTFYNNRAIGFDEKYLRNAQGKIRLLDNDNDGEYELIFVEDYYYAEVESVEPSGFTAGFSDFDKYIDTASDEVVFTVTDSNGEILTPYDIKKGDVLEMQFSDDRLLISIKICKESYGGNVRFTDSEENTVGIDDKEYPVSKRLSDEAWSMLSVGNAVSVVVNTEGRIVNVRSADADFKYGYLLKILTDESSDEINMRLIDSSGKTEILKVAQKVRVDPKNLADSERSDCLLNMDGSQMIRYALNASGEISKIDMPEKSSKLDMFEYRPSDDSMIQYEFGTDTFLYRQAPNSCMPYFNLVNTTIFKVPKDILQTEYAMVGTSSSILVDNASYTLAVYDIDESGAPSVAVMEYNSVLEMPTWKDKSYIVEKIKEGLTHDDEVAYEVTCWSEGRYYTLFLPYTVNVVKDNGETLCPGDIFRARLMNDGVTIISMCVDIYLNDGIPVGNTSPDAVIGGGNVNIAYQIGRMYRISARYGYIATQTDIFGDYLYTLNDMKNVHLNTSNIAAFDTKTGEVRPITLDEIRTYSAYREDCDYVTLRQSRFATESIFVYE